MGTGKVAGVTMMRDEEDVAYHTLMHLGEEGVDAIYVADNRSVDGTLDALHQAKVDLGSNCQVTIVDDPEVGYYQSRKMTNLARQAAFEGAEWIIPFDADELWFTNGDRLAIGLREQPEHVQVVQVPLYNHFTTLIDPPGSNPFETIQWRQNQPGALPKVCFRWREDATILQGNHAVTFSNHYSTAPSVGYDFQLRHFPYRSYEQLARKAKNGAEAYNNTDLSHAEGAHWRQYGAILEQHGDAGLRQVFERWYSFLAPVEEGMVFDPAPFRRWRQ